MPSLLQPLKKRDRDDDSNQMSRDEYDMMQQERDVLSTSTSTFGGTFQRASQNVVATRKIVLTREQELYRHTQALNENFVKMIARQHHENDSADWLNNMHEYINYAREIEAKYARSKGHVFTFGSGDTGQLAHGVENDHDMMVKYPRIVKFFQNRQIVRIACGGLHTAAVTNEGEVFTWGCNDDGALGRVGDENFPAIVQGFAPKVVIIEVVAGDCHTAALTLSGEVYTWGSYKDKDGKLWCDADRAKNSFKKKQLTPFQVRFIRDAVDLKCGDSFNLARTSDGSVFSWGLGEMGQLGRPVQQQAKDDATGEYLIEEMFASHLTPAKMLLNEAALPPVKAMGCGSYHAMLSLTANGHLYTTGLNNYGQLGIGSIENSWALCLVEDLVSQNVCQMDGGSHHSLVLTTQGEMFAFGRGDSGQLGTTATLETGFYKDRPVKVSVMGVPALAAPGKSTSDVCIQMITCGANHSLALSSENEVYSWGYGDMLALGHGQEQDENRPRKLDWSKASFHDSKVIQVEAGGQHSAILAVAKDGTQQLFT